MKIQTLLGNRIKVQPLDLVKKKKGMLHMPVTGETITASPCYQAVVLQLGDGLDEKKSKAGVVNGARVLLVKGGALELEDGARIIAADDIIGVIDPSEPQPE